MRIQLRLSYEARVILEEEKLNYLKENIKMTSGEVVDEICKKLSPNLDKIDWERVQKNPEYDGILAHYTDVSPSALNLSEDTIIFIDKVTEVFNDILEMKRTVYRSFVVRMILKAFILDKNGSKIFI